MTEQIISPEAAFLAKVHQYTAKADELINAYTLALPFLDHPEIPEESRTATVETIETLTVLKLLVTMLVERELEVNDAMNTIVSELQARITKVK